ncbi:MAG: class I SAM-dependent methyltransferase [Nitrococcus mobilis]|nr:class I SAM-dependent methyltransferase [Nitrococcus mobilis]
MPKPGTLAGILPSVEECRAAARRLAGRLGAKLIDSPPTEGLYLACSVEGLWLRLRTARRDLAIRAELGAGRQAYRAGHASPRGEAIARACGLPRYGPRYVVDATAGLGRDAHILARLGARVTLLERSPVILALLEDGLDRASRQTQSLGWLGRMRLIGGDAAVWLRSCTAAQRPEVVFLDPMYPRQTKGGAPGKEMQILQALLGTADDAGSLLQAARAAASDRVVVKRPRQAEPLAGELPHYRIIGRSTRFDVYLHS